MARLEETLCDRCFNIIFHLSGTLSGCHVKTELLRVPQDCLPWQRMQPERFVKQWIALDGGISDDVCVSIWYNEGTLLQNMPLKIF